MAVPGYTQPFEAVREDGRFLEQADPFEPNVSSRSCFFSFTPDNRPPAGRERNGKI
jgi:hypothetical protein